MKTFTIQEIANGYLITASSQSVGLTTVEHTPYYIKSLTEIQVAITSIAAAQKAAYEEAHHQQAVMANDRQRQFLSGSIHN